MQYSVIFDNELFEKKIQEVRVLALTLNESSIDSHFSKYPKHIFEPINEFLNESFLQGIVKGGENFVNNFPKNAREIATRMAASIKEFSYKKTFITVSKMMHKLKAKYLKSLMVLLEPLREAIIRNGFCDEDNKFNVNSCFNKLVSLSKEVGKDAGAKELLSEPILVAMKKNINLQGTGELRESKEEESEVGKAKFDKDDVKYLAFFQKLMFKLGIKDAKLNGFLAVITQKASFAGVGAIIASFLPTAGLLAGITGAIASAPLLVIIVGAILFGIGLFMFATWLLKPYPTIENCEIFLGTIFQGANPFDFPEVTLDTLISSAEPPEDAKKMKSPFKIELIEDLAEHGVDAEDEDEDDMDNVDFREIKKLVKKYDDLDIDILEDEDEIEKNKNLTKQFIRKCFTKKGRDDIQDLLSEIDDEDEENEFTKGIEEFLSLIDKIYASSISKLEDKKGNVVFPYALSYKKLQNVLKSRYNSLDERMTRLIDVTDHFIDRIDKFIKANSSKEGSSKDLKRHNYVFPERPIDHKA